MSDFLKGKKCAFCSNPATRVNFAQIICDNEECIRKAMDARGGPGGHKLEKE